MINNSNVQVFIDTAKEQMVNSGGYMARDEIYRDAIYQLANANRANEPSRVRGIRELKRVRALPLNLS